MAIAARGGRAWQCAEDEQAPAGRWRCGDQHVNNECVSETLGDWVVVRLRGEVDLSWSQQVRRAILNALGATGKVGVELSEVSYIDSSGIAALVEGLQNA